MGILTMVVAMLAQTPLQGTFCLRSGDSRGHSLIHNFIAQVFQPLPASWEMPLMSKLKHFNIGLM